VDTHWKLVVLYHPERREQFSLRKEHPAWEHAPLYFLTLPLQKFWSEHWLWYPQVLWLSQL